MKIKEVVKYIVNDSIVIDKDLGGGDWLKVYSGDCFGIPASLLESEVKMIAPLSRYAIEIVID